MDEVFYIGEDQCRVARAATRRNSSLTEVRAIAIHLKPAKRQLWLGRPLLDGKLTGLGDGRPTATTRTRRWI